MFNQYNNSKIDDIAPTQLTNCGITTSSSTVLIKYQNYRIRKLTPRECWRLMGVKDEQFDKLFDIQKLYLQGDNECNAKFVDAKERQKQSDLDASAFCIIKDILNMETLKQTKTKNVLETEQIKNVKFVIEKLAKAERWDTVLNITKCLENGEMLYTLIKDLDQHRMAIIELEKEGKENTENYMKISLEENYSLPKLYIILTLIALITKLKIYTFMKAKASIQGNIAIIENSSKSIDLKILSLEMEFTTQKLSSTQLYKLAGNSIVVDVLMGIFKNLFLSDEGTKGQLILL